MNIIKIKRIVSWLLVIMVALLVVSGYGITNFRTVQSLTFGWLNKPLAFRIHEGLALPFIVLVVVHIALNIKSWLPGLFNKPLNQNDERK